MGALYRFFRPTLYKWIFTVEWVVYVLLRFVERRTTRLDQLLVALGPFLFLYCVGCAFVAWSQRADRIAGAGGLARLVAALIAIDQLSKAAIVSLLPAGATLPLVEGWLHLTHVRNPSGSWLTPEWMKPLLALAALLVLPLSVIVHRYYIARKRKSLWVDAVFVGVFAGYASWLIDIYWRGYVVDIIHIPGLVAVDLKDLYLSLGLCVVVEVLDNPGISRAYNGWRAEIEGARTLLADLAVFATGELRACWNAVKNTAAGRG